MTLKNKTILLVDDDERNRFALTSFLESINVNVITANDGTEAIKLLEEGIYVDLILLDIMMPLMDGYDTLKALRENKSFKDIPVIAVTARAMKGDKEKCIAAGASDYIAKPINLKSCVSTISHWI